MHPKRFQKNSAYKIWWAYTSLYYTQLSTAVCFSYPYSFLMSYIIVSNQSSQHRTTHD